MDEKKSEEEEEEEDLRYRENAMFSKCLRKRNEEKKGILKNTDSIKKKKKKKERGRGRGFIKNIDYNNNKI